MDYNQIVDEYDVPKLIQGMMFNIRRRMYEVKLFTGRTVGIPKFTVDEYIKKHLPHVQTNEIIENVLYCIIITNWPYYGKEYDNVTDLSNHRI